MRFIVDFTSTATTEQIQGYLTDNNAVVLKTFSIFDKVYLVETNQTLTKNDIIENIINDEDSTLKLLDYPKTTVVPDNNDDWWKISSFMSVDFQSTSITYDKTGQNAIVYLVDSGVMKTHPEFNCVDIQELFSFNSDFADYNGHGTALASLISGNTCSLTSTTIKSVKIFQNGTPTLQSHLLAAFDAIGTDASNNPDKLCVVNLSWAIDKNVYIENKIRLLIASGVYVVTSAGNSGIPIENVTPASMPEVITVGSYDQNFKPCNFSDYTAPISLTTGTVNNGALDVWAPGEQIKAATLDGGYGVFFGTSISAAIHSAAIAHNSFMFVSQQNTISNIVYDNFVRSFNLLSTASCSRYNILILEGQYTSSINAITTYHTENDDTNYGMYSISALGMTLKSGETTVEFFPTNIFESISTSVPLPDGFTMEWPWLTGNKIVTELFEWNAVATLTYKNGMVREVPMNIIIIPTDFDINADNLDPELKIRLKAAGDGCFDHCEDDCTSGNRCACGVPKIGCICLCTTCVCP